MKVYGLRRFVSIMAFAGVAIALGPIAHAGGKELQQMPQANGGSHYKLVKKVMLGGDGGWDYLLADPTAHRVFISRGTHTLVVNAEGNKIGDIPDTPGVHGIALAPGLNRGYTSNGQSNSVTVFDLKTLQIVGEIKIAGQNPDSILYDPASKRIFTFNGGSADSTAIDAISGTVVGTIALGGKPETAQADGVGHIFVNIEDKSEISEIDSKAMKVLNTWSVAPCESPSSLAFDVEHHRLFAGCDNKIMAIVDSGDGKVIATLPIGSGVDAGGFDPGTGLAFASCGEGVITVVREDSPDKYSVIDTIRTQRGARTMTLDTKTHNIFTVTAQFGATPAPTLETPRPRPAIKPGTFTLLIYSRQQ